MQVSVSVVFSQELKISGNFRAMKTQEWTLANVANNHGTVQNKASISSPAFRSCGEFCILQGWKNRQDSKIVFDIGVILSTAHFQIFVCKLSGCLVPRFSRQLLGTHARLAVRLWFWKYGTWLSSASSALQPAGSSDSTPSKAGWYT